MRRYPFWLVGAVLLLSNMNAAFSIGTTDEIEWRLRFYNDAPKGWSHYASKAAFLQGKIAEKTTASGGKRRVVSEFTNEVKQAPGCAMIINQGIVLSDKPDHKGRLHCINPQYQFNLVRNDASSPWAISLVNTDLDSNKKPSFPDTSTPSSVRSWTCTPIAMYGIEEDWPALLTLAEFHVASVEPSERAGKSLVKISFEISRTLSKEHFRAVKSGTATFDPNHLWVMVDCDFLVQWWRGPDREPSMTHVSKVLEYADSDASMPILKKVIERGRSEGSAETLETVSMFDLSSTVPEENVFTLSAFGLPEPTFHSRPRIRWYVWSAIGGIICIAAGIILSRWGRRKIGLTT
jgi:hypothetical protein